MKHSDEYIPPPPPPPRFLGKHASGRNVGLNVHRDHIRSIWDLVNLPLHFSSPLSLKENISPVLAARWDFKPPSCEGHDISCEL